MPIEVRTVLPIDLDILERCDAVATAAFASNHTTPVVFPGPFPPDASATNAREVAKSMREDGFRLFAAVDTDIQGTDAVVGWAKWFVYEESTPKPKIRTYGPGLNLEAAKAQFGAIDEVRERNMTGKPSVYLSVLVVHPDHQGKGVGKKLLSWGLQEAARLNLPVWLESSPAGKPLYDKSGFKVVDKIEVPFDRFGLDQPFVVWGMQWDLPNRRCP
ncbi:hypothetical protein ACHAQA_008942 [Verticillium albo-atrum]